MNRPRAVVAVTVLSVVMASATLVSYAEEPETLEALIVDYLEGRGAEVQIAPDYQLARRYAMDLSGVVPSIADLQATKGMSPGEMVDYFTAKGAMAHTGGEMAHVWINLLKDADHFLFSNSTQFSQVGHITEFRKQLRRCYADSWSFEAFARWALKSQLFLNRFPSASDRANAAFFLFLGRDSLPSEVPVGNMWNGYKLLNPDLEPSDAESDPDYHVYVYDPNLCSSGQVNCDATLWSTDGSTPDEAIDLIVGSPMFAEATVNRYWRRYLGVALPGVEFPDVRRLLAEGFVESGYDLTWLIRELITSPAYTQEMMFR